MQYDDQGNPVDEQDPNGAGTARQALLGGLGSGQNSLSPSQDLTGAATTGQGMNESTGIPAPTGGTMLTYDPNAPVNSSPLMPGEAGYGAGPIPSTSPKYGTNNPAPPIALGNDVTGGNPPAVGSGAAPAPAPGAAPAAGSYGAIQGFDTGKLNDTGYSSAKYTPAVKAFSAALGSGVQLSRNGQAPMVDYLKTNGFPNAVAVGDDKIDFGDGNGPIDVVQQNGSIWFQNGQDRFGAAGAPGASGATGAAGAGGSTGAGGLGAASSTLGNTGVFGPNALTIQGPGAGAVSTPGTASSTRDLLMQQMNLNAGPTDASDPTLNGAITAYDTQSQRDQQSDRDAIAERAYAGGNLDTGGMNTAIQASRENAAGKRASFAGNLTYQEAQNKRNTLTQQLQLATQSGLTQQAQDLQGQIAQIDAQLRAGGLGFNYANLAATMNRDATLGGLRG